MLRIRTIVLDWLRSVQPLVVEIARHDANLANQLQMGMGQVSTQLMVLLLLKAPIKLLVKAFQAMI